MSRRFAKMAGWPVVLVALTMVVTGNHAAQAQPETRGPGHTEEKGRTERLTLINGDTISGFVRCLNKEKQLVVEPTLLSGVVTVPIENVQRINCDPASEPLPAGTDKIVLTNQDAVSGKVKSMDSHNVVLETSYAGEVQIRRSMVKYILFGAATRSKEIAKSIPPADKEEDKVFLVNQDRASGKVMSLKEDNLALKGDYGTITLAVDHVTAVVLNTAKRQQQKRHDNDVQAYIHNGDRLTLSLKELDADQLSGDSESLGQVRIDRAAIKSMVFHHPLLAYWKFDEGKGKVAYASDGTHRATIHGATWATGKVGGALSFDGVDDYVAIPDMKTMTDVSVSFWIKVHSFTHPHYMGAIASKNGTSFFVSDQKMGFGLMIAGNPDMRITYALPLDAWKHVVASYDGSVMKCYVDGTKIGEIAIAGASWRPVNMRIGAGAASPGKVFSWYYFDGLIDEVAIYDYALSPEEIQKHYQNGLEGKGY